jgi:hypothetical protein
MSTCQRCGRCFTEPTPLEKLKLSGYRFDDLAHDRWVFKSKSFLEGAPPSMICRSNSTDPHAARPLPENVRPIALGLPRQQRRLQRLRHRGPERPHPLLRRRTIRHQTRRLAASRRRHALPGPGHAQHRQGPPPRLRSHARPQTRLRHRLLRLRRRHLARQLQRPRPGREDPPVNFYIPGCPPRPRPSSTASPSPSVSSTKRSLPSNSNRLEFPIPRYHPEALSGRDEMVVYEKLDKV